MDHDARAPRHTVKGTTALAVVVVAVLCVGWFGLAEHSLDTTRRQVTTSAGAGSDGFELLSSMYSPPADRVEAAFDLGDGQLYAGMATDPLVRRPEMVRGGRSEQAYRYQRPAYGWLGWVLSGGRRGAVAFALMVLTALSVVGLVAVLAGALETRGADPFIALVMLVAPGVLANLMWIGPEVLATTLVLFGVLRVLSDDRGRGLVERVDPVALACFAAAGLCRESMLLVPATLAVVALVHRRWASALRLSLTAVPYLAWVAFLQVRIGSWPSGSVPGRVSAVPLLGLVHALSHPSATTLVFVVASIGLGVAAIVMSREPLLRWLVVSHLAFAAFMGETVWSDFDGFGRVLLPLVAFGILAVAPVVTTRAPAASPGVNKHVLLPTEVP